MDENWKSDLERWLASFIGGMERRIAAAAAQLPRQGGLGPPQRPGDGADRTAAFSEAIFSLSYSGRCE
jgi:hypothetical protein